jgi:hypothetical protein
MTTGIRLKYVHRWVDNRSGGARARYYFRRPGFKRVPLPGLPGSSEFMEAYQAALAGQALPRPMIGASRTKAGSISALIVSYFASAAFLSLRPATQQTYRNILERFRTEHGDKPVALLTRQHINAILASKVLTPAAANHWLRLIKSLMALLSKTNGARTIRRLALSASSRAPMVSIPGQRGKSRNSRPRIRLAARRGSRWRYCSILLNAAAMSWASDGSIFAMAFCISARRKQVPHSRSPFTTSSPASSQQHPAPTSRCLQRHLGNHSQPLALGIGSASSAMRPNCQAIVPPMGYEKQPAGGWQRLVAVQTLSPRSAVIGRWRRSPATPRRQTRSGWRGTAWQP